jgi:hypothetical protein
MGMGYGANFAETVEQDFIKEVCPEALEAFLGSLDKGSDDDDNYLIDLDTFACECACMNDDALNFPPYERLCEAFKEKTGIGLNLSYHDVESDGDRYDGVDGVYWSLDFEDVYVMTPAALKIADKIKRQFFVNFG